MFDPDFSSALLQQAVDALSRLPGVGRKTALRYALYLLRHPQEDTASLAESLLSLRQKVCYCSRCHMLSDTPLCPVCADTKRDHGLICVVEDIRDVMSIEQTGRYRGLYHVLGGIISPMDGVGPSDLELPSLLERLREGSVREVILALNTTLEGETTAYYIYNQLRTLDVEVTTIARGVAFGDELEYTDQLTLGRSIENRTTYNPTSS